MQRVSDESANQKGDRITKVVKTLKLRALQNGLAHGGQHKVGVLAKVIRRIQANEALQEPENDDNQERKENDGFQHHDFEHDQHGSKETNAVQIQQHARPDHRRYEGQKVVGNNVVVCPLVAA